MLVLAVMNFALYVGYAPVLFCFLFVLMLISYGFCCFGLDPLMLAVMHGKTGCVEKLIHAGANVCYALLLFY